MSKKFTLRSLAAVALLSSSSLVWAESASPAHGFVDFPASRSFLCSVDGGKLNKNCGAIEYEPQSLEAPKGFPQAGPEDGKIASAGIVRFAQLNEQNEKRWHKVSIKPGIHTFTWVLRAEHSTEKWRFYITKKDWDPNQKLTRSQFDLTKPICERVDNGKDPDKAVSIKGCNIPADYKGYHVILGIWDVADTPNGFYQVIDADIQP